VTRASVLIPTHDHASTLRLAVESALTQTVRDLEVLIIGDGVTADVREVAETLQRDDSRVRFLDFEKGPHHGEVHRHTAVEQSTGEIIAYLCDDDLLMPEHIADMADLLQDHDLAQCLNGFIDPNGRVGLYSGRLDDPQFVARLLSDARLYNFVGITGTAHTREFYDRAGTPWQTTPAGIPPDQYQWRRMLTSTDGVRGTTSDRMTVVGLPTSQGGRDTWSPEARAAELERWAEVVRAPDGQERLDRLVGAGAITQLNEWTRLALDLIDARDELQRALADTQRGNEVEE